MFYYGDVVRVIDKNSLYLGCEGTVDSVDKECQFGITGLCGTESQYFSANQLKLLHHREK
jgi:hypothetical protein